jgi:AcrR family transcriptional regulator
MIVEAAGSSTGSFYFYFENKEDVFISVLDEVGNDLALYLNDAIGQFAHPEGQMRAAVEGLFLYLANDPHAARILVIESSCLGGRVDEVRKAIFHRHTMGVAKTIASVDKSPFREENEIAAWCWVGAVHEAVNRWLEQPPKERRTTAEVARCVGEYNLRAVGVKQ